MAKKEKKNTNIDSDSEAVALLDNEFCNQIASLLKNARSQVMQSINSTMVITYFEIGRKIVEQEQNGDHRASYGKKLITSLSNFLTTEFGVGFSHRNLEQMRKFYIVYSIPQTVSAQLNTKRDGKEKVSIPQTASAESLQVYHFADRQFKLSWSHYLTLIRIENEAERRFYEIEAVANNWSVRELKRQYDSALYTRLALSRDKNQVRELSKNGLILQQAKDIIKDPYILEFLDLPERLIYSEMDLEKELIQKMETFLLELGKGFTFVARQKRISFDDKHFRIDLVFYNRILKCFFLIDLKIGELKHQDIGQMQMYVNYFDRKVKLEEENETIGLILCQNKSDAVVKYTHPIDNKQIFASRYKTILPTKKELKLLLLNQED